MNCTKWVEIENHTSLFNYFELMKKQTKPLKGKENKPKVIPPSIYTGLERDQVKDALDNIDYRNEEQEEEEIDKNWNRGTREDYEGWGDF
jgi:hypothetical protein